MKRLLFILLTISLSCCTSRESNKKSSAELPVPLYGITVDDSWTGQTKLNQIIAAIKAMPVKPTVRIVMSNKIEPKEYITTFREIHKVAYVMASPVDSYYMESYTTIDDYLKRFKESYQALAAYTDIWEVANEINGEGWIGDDRQFNADKMYAAFKYIKGKKARAAVTGYETEPDSHEMSMFEWLNKYVPQDMKDNLDYMIVSYYEDDNHGFQPNWQQVFNQLQTMFPHSKVGFSECGNTADNATTESKTQMALHYYTMPKYISNYIGGYFWWTWVQDCVPHEGNTIWQTINNGMLVEKKNFE